MKAAAAAIMGYASCPVGYKARLAAEELCVLTDLDCFLENLQLFHVRSRDVRNPPNLGKLPAEG